MEQIDIYIKKFPEEQQEIMQKMRKTIHQAVPNLTEKIAYDMPTFCLNGKSLVYFGGFAKHVSFFPQPSGMEAFEDEVKPFKTGKGTMKFLLGDSVPYELITKITKYRAKEVEEKYEK